jgi:O-antigen/teichoic acid export membrane protein
MLIIPRLVGPTLFGYFSAGTLLATRSSAIPEGLASAAYPAMVSAHRKGIKACLRVFAGFTGMVVVTTLIGVVAVNLVARPVAQLLFPGHAEMSETVMRITIWLLPAMGLHFVTGYLLNALDKDALQARLGIIGSICSLLLTAALVSRWGVIGACWSMVLRYPVHLLISVPSIVRTLRSIWVAERGQEASASAAAAAAVAAA